MPDFDRIRELVSRALDRPAAEREVFLQQQCGDPELLAEARALLAGAERTGLTGELDGRVAAGARSALGAGGRPPVVEGYELLERLGEGGMGVVWVARQQGALEREVALKLIRPGFDTGKVIARFEAERRTLARMEHPGIAQVFDAGTTDDGLPWFAMELVRGEPIDRWCEQHGAGLPLRLELFGELCQAVQHAHQKGILHRDLKPSNTLVTRRDGAPAVKVIDFGIAKALGEPGAGELTMAGQVVGTPDYMAPERLAGGADLADTRSDVYSLGVVLYLLLAGRLPFAGTGGDAQRSGRTPPRPSTTAGGGAGGAGPRRRDLEGDLDWITLRALAPEPEGRYGTVHELLDDLRRHREGLPVAAGPPTLRYRAGKFARRHRGALGVAALVLLSLAGGLVASERERARAEAARAEADAVTGFLSGMLASVDPAELGRETSVRELLDQAWRELDHELDGQPVVRARLLSTIGRTYHALGDHARAREALDEALGLVEAKGARALELRAERAVVLRDAGDVEAAIGEQREVLAGQRALLGRRHPDALATQLELAGSLQQRGRADEARAEMEEARAGLVAELGPQHASSIGASRNLGNLLAEAGEFDAAAPLLHEVLKASRERFGPRHPETVEALQSIALLHYDLGELDACQQRLEEVLELQRELYGPSHRKALDSATNLASVQSNRGELDAAIALLEDTLPLARAQLGNEHRTTLSAMNNLAYAYAEAGDFAAAEPLLDDLVETRRRVRGPDHLFTLVSEHNLAELYRRTGRPAPAARLHRDVLARRRQALGPGHPHVMVSMANLASALRELGQYVEADTLYIAAWEAQEAQLGADHPDAVRTAREAARLHEQWGRAEEARHWGQRAGGG